MATYKLFLMHSFFTIGNANRKHCKFKPDPNVPAIFTAKNGDYWKSGWSRGHMAPAGDNKYDQVKSYVKLAKM